VAKQRSSIRVSSIHEASIQHKWFTIPEIVIGVEPANGARRVSAGARCRAFRSGRSRVLIRNTPVATAIA